MIMGLLPLTLFFFSKRKETGFFVFFLYLLYSGLSDFLITPLFFKIFHSVYFSLRLFTIVEYLLITIFLYKNINSVIFKKVIIFLSVLFFSYAIFDFFQFNPNHFDSIPSGIENILIIVYSIFILFEKIREPDSLFLYNTPIFWIVVGLILYFSGTFFLYIYSQTNLKDPDYVKTYQFVNSAFGILKHLLFSVAFLVKPPKEGHTLMRSRSRSRATI